MELNFHVNGAERKRLVQIISDWLGVPAKYCGAPTFNYEVDYFTIDRNGSLSFDDRADSEVIERLLQHIYDEGFDIDQSHTEDEDEPCAVCISMPKSLFTDSNLENLKALIAAKGSLIKKALGVADLPLEISDTKVSFPWFPATPTPDEMNAYDTFICKLCEMARNQNGSTQRKSPPTTRNTHSAAFSCAWASSVRNTKPLEKYSFAIWRAVLPSEAVSGWRWKYANDFKRSPTSPS